MIGIIVRNAAFAALLSVCLLCTGCFSVKNTDGIRKAVQDGAEAKALTESIVVTFTPQDQTYRTMAGEYALTRAKYNAYLTALQDDIERRKAIDVSLEDYTGSEAKPVVDAYLVKARQALGAGVDPVTATATAAKVAQELIDFLIKLDRAAKQRGVEDSRKQIENAKLPVSMFAAPQSTQPSTRPTTRP